MLIELFDMCQGFNSLPQAGGVFDQDSFLVEGMQHVAVARYNKQKKEQAEQEAKTKARGQHASR